MKTFLSTILLLCLTTLAVAQRKAEFGLVVKAGTFAIPRKNLELKSLSQLDFKVGRNFSFGLWHAWPINERLRLSTELLYRAISSRTEDRTRYITFETDNNGITARQNSLNIDQTVYESSVSLPIKFFYTLKKGGKTSVSLGGGLSQIFASQINTHFEDNLLAIPNYQKDYAYMGKQYYGLQYQLNAGFHWMLDQKTSVGFEYVFEPLPKFYYKDANMFSILINQFCKNYFCHYSAPYLRTRMNSFSVSLRHNILD
jgi:hypothetical protein